MNKKEKEEIYKSIEKALGLVRSIFSVFMLGCIFAMAGFAFLTLTILWDLNFIFLITSWGFLFYCFSVIVFDTWIRIMLKTEVKK